MVTVFIFHGTAGWPEENWFPWLKQKLEEKDCEVIVPQFPTPEGQSLQAWLDVFQKFEGKITDDTIMIGHSLGGVFLLRLMENFLEPIKAAIFVGTPIGIGQLKNQQSDNNFSGFDFNWDNIKNKAKQVMVYQSDTDPYVPLENGKHLAKHFGINMAFIPNAGHFNKAAGYVEFPELFEKIKEVL